jgi:hypothetical protein
VTAHDEAVTEIVHADAGRQGLWICSTSPRASSYAPGSRKVIGIYTRYLHDDPVACRLWLCSYVGQLLRTVNKRGR